VRRGVTLFQYKYYSEQVPLSLSHEEMDLLVDTIVNPPDDDHQSCLIASKILIKVILFRIISVVFPAFIGRKYFYLYFLFVFFIYTLF
jgi:hypothetical protein